MQSQWGSCCYSANTIVNATTTLEHESIACINNRYFNHRGINTMMPSKLLYIEHMHITTIYCIIIDSAKDIF